MSDPFETPLAALRQQDIARFKLQAMAAFGKLLDAAEPETLFELCHALGSLAARLDGTRNATQTKP